MEHFMFILCQVTFFSSVTAALLLIVKKLCRVHISPQLHVSLWLILFIRVLIPSLPESIHSVYNYVPGYVQMVEGTVLQTDLHPLDGASANSNDYLAHLMETGASAETTLEITETSASEATPAIVADSSSGYRIDIVSLLFVIYVIGVLLFVLRMAVSYHALYARTLRSAVQCDNEVWNHYYRQSAHEMGYRPRALPPLYISAAPSMQIGVLKPIVLVNAHTDEADLPMVFAHELNHCKHHDNLLLFVSNLLAAFMWFNPLIWLACKCVQDDVEILCDARTVRLPFVNKREYAVLLYQSTHAGTVRTLRVASSISAESMLLKKRLKHLAEASGSLLSRIISLAISVVLIVLCLTNPTHALLTNNDVYVQNGSMLAGSAFDTFQLDEGISGVQFYSIIYTTLKNKTGGDTSPIPLYLGNGTLTALTRHAVQHGIADGSFEEYMLEVSRSSAMTYEQAAVLLDTVIRLIDHSEDTTYGDTIPRQISEDSFIQVLQRLPDNEARALLSCYNRGSSSSAVDFAVYYTEEEINEISSRIANDWLREKFLIFYQRIPLHKLPDGFCEENELVTEYDAVYQINGSLTEREIQIVRDIVSIAKTGNCEDVFYLKARCDVYPEAYIDALYKKAGYSRAEIHEEYAALGVSSYSGETGVIDWMPYCSEICLKNHGSSPEATLAVLSVCSYGIMAPEGSYFPYDQPLYFGEAMRILCLLYAGMVS